MALMSDLPPATIAQPVGTNVGLGATTVPSPGSSMSNPGLSSDIGAIISLISGLSGTSGYNKLAAMADPWAQNRPQYQTELNKFMADPSSIFQDPAFQAAQQVGAENISRQAGAAGMAGSGNRLADLFSFGQSQALGFENQKFNQLAQLAGVNAGSPVAAAQIGAQGLQTQGTNLATGLAGVIPMILQMLGMGGQGGGLGGIISQLFGGGGLGSGVVGGDLTGIGGLTSGDLTGVGGLIGDLGGGDGLGGFSDLFGAAGPFG